MNTNEYREYLISRHIFGDLTETGQKELNRLIERGEISPDELEDYSTILEMSGHIFVPDFDAGKAYDKVIASKAVNKRFFRKTLIKSLRIAAIVVIGIFLGVLLNRYLLNNKEPRFVEIETKKGDKIHITLPEGNEVWLNSQSKIKYPENFSGINRHIELSGEAYFKIHKNYQQPVIITCSTTKIVATTASFNIRNTHIENATEITVETGWISLSDPMWEDQHVVLEEGFRGTINKQLPLFIEQNNNPNYLAWQTGKLVFEKTPLLKVAETLSDVYDVNIRIDGDVKYCLFSRSYNKENLEHILYDVRNRFKTNISRENRLIIISGNNCNI